MSNQLLASKTTIEEEAPATRQIPSLDTMVMGFVGVTQKGPFGATLVQSFTDFVNIFGSYIAASNLAAVVEGFFENGGTSAYIVRVQHYTTISDPASGTSAVATVGLQNATPVLTLTVNGKYNGTYANGFKIMIAAATSGDATAFNLEVIDATSLVRETWPNVTMDTTSPQYVVDVVNDPDSGSTLIAVVDASVSGSVSARRPVNVLSAAMSAGADGLASLADADYVGSSASATGLRALDVVDDLTVLAVPGVATTAVHNGIVTYCESTRGGQVFGILDPPANNTAAQIITYVTSTAALLGLSEYAAIYWPQILVENPSSDVYGSVVDITIPPSGHVAGMFSRNDNAKDGGVWTTPAGTEEGKLFSVDGFETTDVNKEPVRDLVFPQRINPIHTAKGQPKYVDGARTLKGDGNFPSVAQRRGVSFVERSIKSGIEYARHKNNTPALRAGLYRTVYAFLAQQTKNGAFASSDPAKAFFVDFGDALNTIANQVVGRIGLATVQPAEFARLKFSQDTSALNAS